MARLFVAAGEGSGDRLASELVGELRLRRPDLALSGVCGPRLRAVGVPWIARAEDTAAVGLIEGLTQVPRAAVLLGEIERAWQRDRPDLVLTVDAPDLMGRVCERAKRRQLRVVHWVSPQVWAWRRNRTATWARLCDELLCLFPFEPAYYAGTGLRATFVGHPAVDRVRNALPARPPGPGSPRIGLLPGSRLAELTALSGLFADVAERIRSKHPGAAFATVRSPTLSSSLPIRGLREMGDVAELAAWADATLVASGTATLELAATSSPMVVVYKVNAVTAAVGKRVLQIRHIALPNVLAGHEVVPEHVQRLDPAEVTADLLRLCGPAGDAQRRELRRVVDDLQATGAIARTADAIERWLPKAV